jgi:hypothetical protein
MSIKHLTRALGPAALAAVGALALAGNASAACSTTYNGTPYCAGGTPPASVFPGAGPITSWGGTYGGSPAASHCDNLGDPTYAATHTTGVQPGASEYHLDLTGDGTSCGGPALVTATGWLTVAGHCLPNSACDPARTNNSTAMLGGGAYVGVPAAGVGAGGEWVPLP